MSIKYTMVPAGQHEEMGYAISVGGQVILSTPSIYDVCHIMNQERDEYFYRPRDAAVWTRYQAIAEKLLVLFNSGLI